MTNFGWAVARDVFQYELTRRQLRDLLRNYAHPDHRRMVFGQWRYR